MGKATQDLRHEHDAILHVLQILENALTSSSKDDETKLKYFEEMVYFLKIFADKCHHGKEETILFKAMTEKGIANEGGPIGVMLSEHTQGREHIAAMSKALQQRSAPDFKAAALKYRDLLRNHIKKENDILFNMADRVLNAEEQFKLYEQFERHEEDVIGSGVHEKLHAMIDNWAAEFDAA